MRRVLAALERGLARAELGVVALAYTAMLALSLADIVGRNLFGTSLPQGDVMLRELVLWVALPGALLAVASGRHLALDPAGLAQRPGFVRWTALPFNLIAAVVCAALAYAGWTYWREEFDYFHAVWLAWSAALMPAAFALMAVHFGLRAALAGAPQR